MFFTISKILGFFANPSGLVISIGFLGFVLLATRWARAGTWLLAACFVALAILGLSPVGNMLMIPLEQRFPPWDASRGPPDGIIVLGGAISPDVSAARNDVVLNEAAERLTVVAELARRYPNARILFSGGTGELIPGEREAPFALRLLESFGIPRARILLEERSRNTVENAVYSKQVARPMPGERWLLVTSAYHLPRAIGVFRTAGFPVEPYPVDWRTRGIKDALRPFGSVGDGLRRVDTAVREWVGLAVYWITGRSSELFPGPMPDVHSTMRPILHCRDSLDLQQKIGICQPAQDAERAAGRVAGKISLQDPARLRHVVRIADIDRDFRDVGDFRASGRESLGEVVHHHLGLGVEIVGRQHFAVHVRRDLAGAEDELLRALRGHHMRIVCKRLRDAIGVDPR
jgi:uncharacterized SAM-binding protein YcdF (DUF218 family)